MKDTSFSKLFEPGRIGNVRIKNRIVMLPMGTAYATAIGEITQKSLDHFVERAKGGVGLIIVGNCSPFGRISANGLQLDADWYMAGHYELVEAVHAEGTPICIQLNHPGREMSPAALEGRQPVSPSDVTCSFLGEHTYPKPRPLEREEIYQIMDRWAEAAGRAKKVGYDMVELHGAHGYLIEQFMSPYTNKRNDEFGGSLENRMRFPVELLKRVKSVVGASFPVGFRFGAEEFIEGGITLKDSPAMARILQDAGAAYLNVTCGFYETATAMNDSMRDPEGWKHYIWAAIKQAVDIPVIGGGGLRTPAFCESVLEQGKADFVGLARPLLADPHWPNKARAGELEDIRLCISCGECNHWSSTRRRLGERRCSVNPATGRERRFVELKPAPVRKRVAVVGGGPGGMEAARIAALRGHDVTLYDRGERLGGALLLAATPPGKDRMNWFIDYLRTQLKKANVKIELGTEVTSDFLLRKNPDVVVIATGSRPVKPSHLAEGIVAWDVLSGKEEIVNKKVAVIGGGMVGAETAEYLAQKGNRVTVIEMLPKLAADMELHHRFVLQKSLAAAGVEALTGREVVEATKGRITAVDKESGQRTVVEADVIVVALGAVPDRDLADALEGKVPELYTVGDCNEPRVMIEAVYEGSCVGRRI